MKSNEKLAAVNPDDDLLRDSSKAAANVLGYVPVEFNDTTPLTPRERRLVREGAKAALHTNEERLISGAVQDALHDAIDELEKKARKDPLTGLPTKEVLNEDLVKTISVAKHEKAGVALWCFDGNGLKFTNDSLGHSAGDNLIKAIAGGLTSVKHARDGAYRGGRKADEFFVLMPLVRVAPDRVDEFLEAKGEEFKKGVDSVIARDDQFKDWEERFRLGVGVGVAYIDLSDPQYGGIPSSEIASQLLHDADREMLFSKELHRQQRNEMLMQRGDRIPDDPRL